MRDDDYDFAHGIVVIVLAILALLSLLYLCWVP